MSKGAKTVVIISAVIIVMALACAGVFAIAATVGATNEASSPTSGQSSGPSAHTPGQGIKEPEKGAATEFGDGVWEVGSEIKAGTYTATVPGGAFAFCTWQRLSGFGGSAEEISEMGVGEEGKRMRVTISPKDVGFQSDGCGRWTRVKW